MEGFSIGESPCSAVRPLGVALVLDPPLSLHQILPQSHLSARKQANGPVLFLISIALLVGLFESHLHQPILKRHKPSERAFALGISPLHGDAVDEQTLLQHFLHIDSDVEIDCIIVAPQGHHARLLTVQLINYLLCLLLPQKGGFRLDTHCKLMFLLPDVLVYLLTAVLSLSEPFEVGEDGPENGRPHVADLVHYASHDGRVVGTTQNGVYDGHQEVVRLGFCLALLLLGRLANSACQQEYEQEENERLHTHGLYKVQIDLEIRSILQKYNWKDHHLSVEDGHSLLTGHCKQSGFFALQINCPNPTRAMFISFHHFLWNAAWSCFSVLFGSSVLTHPSLLQMRWT